MWRGMVCVKQMTSYDFWGWYNIMDIIIHYYWFNLLFLVWFMAFTHYTVSNYTTIPLWQISMLEFFMLCFYFFIHVFCSLYKSTQVVLIDRSDKVFFNTVLAVTQIVYC